MTAVDPVSPASPIPGQPARLVTGLGRLLLAVPRPLAPLLPIAWGYLIWTLSSGTIRISGGGFHWRSSVCRWRRARPNAGRDCPTRS